jgi:hypothetical protein
MKNLIKYNLSIFLTWFFYIALRRPFPQEAYDLIKGSYKATPREKRMIKRIGKISKLAQ